METGLRLHKLHGLGNDFLVALVDELPRSADASRTAAVLCHRRLGVGADGLIYAVVGSGGDSATMRLWNSDGSAAEVSGNGVRCLAHAIAHTAASPEADILIDTVAGPRRCTIRPTGRRSTVLGTTEMGETRPGPSPDRLSRSPVTALSGVLEPDSVLRWDTVSVGNPHVVVEVADLDAVPLLDAGGAVEALFSGGINVHFGAVTARDQLTLEVWERGAGATAACGTGAVAAAAVFHRWGSLGQTVGVKMAGGFARVDLADPITLTGESVYVAAVDAADA